MDSTQCRISDLYMSTIMSFKKETQTFVLVSDVDSGVDSTCVTNQPLLRFSPSPFRCRSHHIPHKATDR